MGFPPPDAHFPLRSPSREGVSDFAPLRPLMTPSERGPCSLKGVPPKGFSFFLSGTDGKSVCVPTHLAAGEKLACTPLLKSGGGRVSTATSTPAGSREVPTDASTRDSAGWVPTAASTNTGSGAGALATKFIQLQSCW